MSETIIKILMEAATFLLDQAALDQQIAEKQFKVQQEIATIANGDDRQALFDLKLAR